MKIQIQCPQCNGKPEIEISNIFLKATNLVEDGQIKRNFEGECIYDKKDCKCEHIYIEGGNPHKIRSKYA